MEKNNIIFLLFCILALTMGCLSSETTDYREVTRVIDADTVELNSSSGPETVRIIGADAPETFGENQPKFFDLEDTVENQKCLDRKAEKADEYVRENWEETTVELKKDELEGPRDQYGRKLAYLIKEEKPLGQKLIEKGYATVFPTDFRYRERYEDIEEKAREESRGLWIC